MFLLFSLLILKVTKQPTIRYSSAIQLRNVYSRNKLCTNVDCKAKFETPIIFSTRPPFNDGWTWSVEPVGANTYEDSRKEVECGANVSFMSLISQVYLGAKMVNGLINVTASHSNEEDENQWTVLCKNNDKWVKGDEIKLRNAKYGCYLKTNFDAMNEKENDGRYKVGCGSLDADAIWESAEGVYILENKVEEKDKNDEL